MKKNTKITIKDIIQEFEKYLKKESRSNNTIICYVSDISSFLNFIDQNNKNKTFIKKLLNINKEEIKRYISIYCFHVSTKTISRKINSIRTFIKFLSYFLEQSFDINFLKEIRHPKFIPKKFKYLNKIQISKLRSTISLNNNLRDLVLIELLLLTGLLINEVQELKVKNLNFKKNLILIKTKEIPMVQKLKALLKMYTEEKNLEPNSYIICNNKTKKNINIRNIRNIIQKYFIKANLKDFTVNDLRNTFIINQLNNNVSPDLLAKILGFKSLKSIEKYQKESQFNENKPVNKNLIEF